MQLSVAAGLQLYEVAPLAVILVLVPKQIVVAGETVKVGVGFTVIVTCVVSEQLPLVPTTVYVVVIVGFAKVLEQFVQLSPVPGLQV